MFFGAFLGPIFVILLMNVVLCVIVIVILIRHFRNTARRNRKSISAKTTVRLLISIIGIMTLFGLSWLFGALTITVSAVRTPAQIIFVVLNSFQGFFIFLFFCALNEEARESWKQVLTCGRYQSQKSSINQADKYNRAYSVSTLSTCTPSANLTLERNNIILSGNLSTLTHTNSQYLTEPNTSPEDVTNSSIDKSNALESTQGVGHEENLLGFRFKRYTTKKVRQHHVEQFEVDFIESSDDEDVEYNNSYFDL